jgi:hypothetical protein
VSTELTSVNGHEAPLDHALRYAAAGISVVPIALDGTKRPPRGRAWKHRQETIATPHEIVRAFDEPFGIAGVCGRVSGNLETLDIDDADLVKPFEAAVHEAAPGLLERLSTVATPRNDYGGRHYRYRLPSQVPGNTKLAQSELRPQFKDDGTPDIDELTDKQRLAPETLIETRGEGGYAILPGSPGQCHQTGLPYKYISGPPLTEIGVISEEEHQVLWRVARTFNRFVADAEVEKGPAYEGKGESPGDAFNHRATWDEILTPAGWTKVGNVGEVTSWRRPGKSIGVSATTGIKSSAGTELFCCFSSNAYPFDGSANGRSCTSYSKFAAYTVLNHAGSYSAAAKELVSKGFGDSPSKVKAPAKLAAKIILPTPFVPFPTASLPAPVSNYIREAARTIGCDETLVALPLLAALAGCIGTTRRIKAKNGWTAPAILWTAAVADSGQQKTPAQNAVVRLLFERQGKDIEAHQERIIEYEKSLATYERDLQQWKRDKNSLKGKPPEKPEEPICKRLLVSDSTIEAIAERLNDNPRGLLVNRDELSGWLGSFDQYRSGKGSDASHWLSCYNANVLLIDRKTTARKTIYVPRAGVSITGGIQPSILGRMLGKTHFENGLAARFALGMPPKRNKRWTDAEIGDDACEALDFTYDSLLRLEFEHDRDGKSFPRDLPLSADGKEAYIEFFNAHGREQAELDSELAALWAKLEETALRIALIVHLVRCSFDDPTLASQDAVDGQSIQTGIVIAQWFGQEGRRIYDVLTESDEQRDNRQLIERIQRLGGEASVREICRGSQRWSTSEVVEGRLNILAQGAAGSWRTLPPPKTGGHATRVFELTPELRNDTRPLNPAENGSSASVGAQESVDNASAEGGDEEDEEWTL